MEYAEKDDGAILPDEGQLLCDLAVLMGGRAGEEILCGTRTPGASADLEKATALAFRMVTDWGLGDRNTVFSARAVEGRVSDKRRAQIEDVAQKLLDDALARAKHIIQRNKVVVERLAKLLIVEETLLEERLNEFWAQNQIKGE